MSAGWKIVGQVGTVIKKNQFYLINIADNKYKQNEDNIYEKEYTIWFNCVCHFEPKASTGDTVIAEGVYIPSKNPNYAYIMKIDHIGIIKKKNREEIGY